MIQLNYYNDTIKLLQGNKKLIRNIIEICIDIFNNGIHSIYYRHSLKGNLKGVSEYEVTGDIRIFTIFEKEKIKFLRIGTHSSLGI